jgi:biotin carboxyl carrier protein
VRVEVEPGQRVTPGQGVIIVEAMKMENELKADGGGVVSRVHVTAGQPVEKGVVLIEFETEDA